MIPKLYKVISGKYVDDTLNYLLAHQGGGVSVNTFTQDIVLTGNTIPLETGFYNTGSFGLFVGSQTPQNLIFGAGEIIYVDTSTLTIVGSLVSISYNLIDSVWTIQDNQKIENEVTNNRDKIPTSQAVYNGLATKQNTLTAGSGIEISNNVISATGGGGGVTVTNLTQDIILTGNTIPLSTGFYNTGNYGLFVGSQTPQNLIFGSNEIIYVDTSTLTIIGSLVSLSYDLSSSIWVIQDNQKIENEITNNRDKIPTSQAVYNKINEVKLISCTIQGASSDTIDVTGWTPIKLPLTLEKINIGNCFTLSNNEITVGSGVSLVRLEITEAHWAKNTDLMVCALVNDTIIGPTIYTRDKETSPTTGTGQVITSGSVIAYANVQEGDKIKLCVRGNAQGNTRFFADTGINVIAISETTTI